MHGMYVDKNMWEMFILLMLFRILCVLDTWQMVIPC